MMTTYQVTYVDGTGEECREEFTDIDEAIQFIKVGVRFTPKLVIDRLRK